MRHASLFSGIGGFDLAAEWMRWENVMQCEIDPFCQRVLRHHFPSAHLYGDIREIDGNSWRGSIDILTGGFPCQPFSTAGRRRGTADDRHLWPEMLRLVREIQPSWVIGENVRGLASWNDGMVFNSVCADLEANGYEVQPFCIPACAVGAPHKRERIWFVAHSIGAGLERRRAKCQLSEDSSQEQAVGNHWSEGWPTAATRLCRVDDGLPRELDGITVPRWRRESLKAYGNAIVPQVAYQIFQAIARTQQ